MFRPMIFVLFLSGFFTEIVPKRSENLRVKNFRYNNRLNFHNEHENPSVLQGNLKAKVEYLEKLINSAFDQTDWYKPRTDNSDLLEGVNDKIIEDYGEFDFIVVGGGTTGSVVASRLSEIEKFKVLLLEAGDWDDDLTDIPYLYTMFQFSDRNWGYYTISQKNGCFGWKNNSFHYPRGKVLGGTGTINGLAYIRGNKHDYDDWESLGNPGWSYNDLLPYFRKMENFEPSGADLRYRGFAGPLNVAYKKPEERHSLPALAATELGIPLIDDYNIETPIGLSTQQRNTKCGKRVSGASAYVKPSMNRNNFNLTLQAYVTQIIVDEKTKTANGVIFVKNGRKYKATARKEVIISGGAINTPQLLMLSGIGPEDELRKHNIKPIVISPVGKYLKEHYGFRYYFRTNRTISKVPFKQLLEEYLQGEGMLTNNGNGVSYAFINTKNSSSNVPNVEIAFYLNTPVDKPIPVLRNFIKEYDDYQNSVNEQTDFTIEIYGLKPKSVGSVTLKSSDPKDFPLFDTGIFNDEDDIQVLYEGIQFMDRVQNTLAARKLDLQKVPIPLCKQHQYESKGFWYCVIKHISYPALHIVGTAKMGPKTDKLAVVDHDLKVYGVKNLRLADCSIMPAPISGHNNAPAFLIGEKVADIIKAQHIK